MSEWATSQPAAPPPSASKPEAETAVALNAKFEAASDSFTYVYGGITQFFAGLEGLIGAPSADIEFAMEGEHASALEAANATHAAAKETALREQRKSLMEEHSRSMNDSAADHSIDTQRLEALLEASREKHDQEVAKLQAEMTVAEAAAAAEAKAVEENAAYLLKDTEVRHADTLAETEQQLSDAKKERE